MNKDSNRRIIVFTQNGCSACESLKKQLKESFKEGKIIEYNLKNENVKKLAKELGIIGTPTFISVKGQEVCVLDRDFNPIICKKVKSKVIL